MKVKKSDLLKSFRLHLQDKVEHEKTLMQTINRHLDGTEEIVDGDIIKSVQKLCKRHNIDYTSVIKHAVGMYND